jgi:predicted ester cyclase
MGIHIAVFALFSLLAAPASAQVQIYCDGQTETLNTYLQIHKVLFMDRDTTRVEEFYADEIISHNNDAGGPGSVVRPDDMRKMWEESLKNNPERVLEDDLILCVDDFVVVRTIVKSSFNTPLAGYEPTGEPYEISAIDIYRFDGGKVVERWGNADVAYIFRQLGFKMVKEDE